MDTSRLKKFAPACRTSLMEQISVKLDYVLTAKTPDLSEKEALVKKIQRNIDREGREHLIERVAYTWFNRFAAFRFLDARGWHPFRLRVISSAKQGDVLPELLQQVRQGVIPEELKGHLPVSRINDLLDCKIPSPNPQAEVQKILLIGVGDFYSETLGAMFDQIDDFAQLLLPDDLLTEHSVIHGFVSEISDADCAEVEILGWLYQFYISEKKDAVMARKKAVPSEDIPAVTQLFTPHWIVRYLVENSLGRLWLRSRPQSRLKEHMPYFVEDPEGQEPADSLTVATPEEIKLLDPACGSGHMLTYAFDLLVKIYEEEGHAPSEIPEKILTHNLFGLEICPRAAQLAQFALVCKAREQSRAAFRRPVQPQVMCLQNVVHTPDEMQAWSAATGVKLSQDELAQLHQFRENTETFGSLIQPVLDGEKLPALVAKIGEQAPAGDLLVQNTHRKLRLVLDQAEMLSQRYQVVVANPPYLNKFTPALKDFIERELKDYKSDLFAAFVCRVCDLGIRGGDVGLMTPFTWMFIKTYKPVRQLVLSDNSIRSLIRPEYHAFFESAYVPVCAFTIYLGASDQTATFIDLKDFYGSELQGPKTLEAISNPDCKWRYQTRPSSIKRVPGIPIAYWISEKFRDGFSREPLGRIATVQEGLKTGENEKFIRRWSEVYQSGIKECERAVGFKWVFHTKGGGYRRWYGNIEDVLFYENDGRVLKESKKSSFTGASNYYKQNISWGRITSDKSSFRLSPPNTIPNMAGLALYPHKFEDFPRILCALNAKTTELFLNVLNPTLNYPPGPVTLIPIAEQFQKLDHLYDALVEIARTDWDNFETSWDFRDLPLLRSGDWEVEPGQPGGGWKGRSLAESWNHYATYCNTAIRRMQELETENNRLWIDAYGLQDELTTEVPEKEITLARADARKDMAAFLSYAVGCMMGRYSLDHPGLILADAGDNVENYLAKIGKSEDEVTFLPDDDAIIPITEDEWFPDDAAGRVVEFLRVTFGPETLEQNLAFLEESLGKELRKYFTANTGGFYADHIKTYKKRPIYWMFESPKKHFRALVYLHRYHKDTVNQLLNGYVREFRHKVKNQIEDLESRIVAETATAQDRRALKTAQDALADIETYERDILLPLARQQIEIDLDDGVKANYPKFGKALAKVAGLS